MPLGVKTSLAHPTAGGHNKTDVLSLWKGAWALADKRPARGRWQAGVALVCLEEHQATMVLWAPNNHGWNTATQRSNWSNAPSSDEAWSANASMSRDVCIAQHTATTVPPDGRYWML